ncbi:MAG: 50S ribosomal protein L9 [Candidatus Dasytiphilus stammeri]
MLIILLVKIPNLGEIGETVKVKPGYARNFLLPKKKALLASKENLKFFNDYRAKIEAQKLNELEIARKRQEQISKLSEFTIYTKSNQLGKLFGSIGINDILQHFNTVGIKVNKKEIILPNGLLRNTGQHEVIIKLHPNIMVNITVNIINK